jgi:hypothetical protein
MVIRVATKDVESAKLLVVDLIGLVGGECVSLRADGEVQLQLRGEASGALVDTLEAVERWLEQTRTFSAEVWVDERSYTVEQRQPSPPGSTSSSSATGGRGAGEGAALKTNLDPDGRGISSRWERSRNEARRSSVERSHLKATNRKGVPNARHIVGDRPTPSPLRSNRGDRDLEVPVLHPDRGRGGGALRCSQRSISLTAEDTRLRPDGEKGGRGGRRA